MILQSVAVAGVVLVLLCDILPALLHVWLVPWAYTYEYIRGLLCMYVAFAVRASARAFAVNTQRRMTGKLTAGLISCHAL